MVGPAAQVRPARAILVLGRDVHIHLLFKIGRLEEGAGLLEIYCEMQRGRKRSAKRTETAITNKDEQQQKMEEMDWIKSTPKQQRRLELGLGVHSQQRFALRRRRQLEHAATRVTINRGASPSLCDLRINFKIPQNFLARFRSPCHPVCVFI